MSFFCSLPEHLQLAFARGQRYIVCTDRQCWLADATAVFERDEPGEMQFCVVDLSTLWDRFAQLVQGRPELTKTELAKLAGVDEANLELWRGFGICCPVSGVYDWHSCFATVVASVLRRRTVPLRVANMVGQFIRTGKGLGPVKIKRRGKR